jgi:hypothetical protein
MTEPAIIRAHIALKELRDAMTDVRQTHPSYLVGQEASAADNCRQILDVMEWNVRALAVYLGVAVTEPKGFYEDDEDPAAVHAAFDAGEKGTTDCQCFTPGATICTAHEGYTVTGAHRE